jgi:hypothetical protein
MKTVDSISKIWICKMIQYWSRSNKLEKFSPSTCRNSWDYHFVGIPLKMQNLILLMRKEAPLTWGTLYRITDLYYSMTCTIQWWPVLFNDDLYYSMTCTIQEWQGQGSNVLEMLPDWRLKKHDNKCNMNSGLNPQNIDMNDFIGVNRWNLDIDFD